MLRVILIGILLVIAGTTGAHAEPGNVRALIIGISNYPDLKRDKKRLDLPRTHTDAIAFKDLLLDLKVPKENITLISFPQAKTVSQKQIIKKPDFEDAWDAHLEKLAQDEDAVSIVFFAGHGLERDRKPHLVMGDYPGGPLRRRFSINLQDLVSEIPGNRVGIFIIDACREDPNATPAGRNIDVAGAFTPVQAKVETIVLYSARSKQVALEHIGPHDPDKKNSVYTRVLIRLLRKYGTSLSIAQISSWTRPEVMELADMRKDDNGNDVPHVQIPDHFERLIHPRSILGTRVDPPEPPINFQLENAKVASLDVNSSSARTTNFRSDAAASRSISELSSEKHIRANRQRSQSKVAYRDAAAPRNVVAAQQIDASRVNTILDCPICPELVALPNGGSTPIAVGKHEVTLAEWYRFERLDEARKKMPRLARDDQYADRRPVTGVSWHDAVAYTKWLSTQVTNLVNDRNRRADGVTDSAITIRYRLPTKQEWERAAEGGDHGAIWPMAADSESDICDYANGADLSLRTVLWANTTCDDGHAREVASVGSYLANDFGLHDMAGNVWEWVQDCFNDNAKDCKRRIAKGGSWRSGPDALKIKAQQAFYAADGRSRLGFRIVQELH